MWGWPQKDDQADTVNGTDKDNEKEGNEDDDDDDSENYDDNDDDNDVEESEAGVVLPLFEALNLLAWFCAILARREDVLARRKM